MKRLLLILSMSIGCISILYPQLTFQHNAIRQGDKLLKYQVEYKDPGKNGGNVLWDFKNLKTLNEEYTVSYIDAPLLGDSIYTLGYNQFKKKDTKAENLLMAVEHGTMYYYMQRNDSLLLLGHENPVVKLQYEKPYVMAVYPINFGQMTYSSYTTQGKYSGTDLIRTQGTVEILADAFGKMILPTGDTISPVLRVKTSQIINDQIKNEQMETVEDQKTLETYRWYTKGYRYPIFETVRNINRVDSTMLFSASFFFPPQDHLYLDTDPDNQELLDQLWEFTEEKAIEFTDLKLFKEKQEGLRPHIYPNPVSDILHVEYMLEQDVAVNIVMSTIDGKVVKNIVKQQQAGMQHEEIDCSLFIQGTYILKIVAGDQTVNGKILKK